MVRHGGPLRRVRDRLTEVRAEETLRGQSFHPTLTLSWHAGSWAGALSKQDMMQDSGHIPFFALRQLTAHCSSVHGRAAPGCGCCMCRH